jgi:aspartate aminotransferase/aminotransferase
MRNINSVIKNMPRSGIRRIMDYAIKLDPTQKNIIHLEVGQPEDATSDIICYAASKAALDGYTKYTQNAGDLELRKIIKDMLQKKKVNVSEDNIFVTPGATFGVSISIGVIINQDDEVLVPDPGYPNFAAAVRHYGGIVKYYTLKEEDNFRLDFNNLKSLVTNKTKLIIINSPSNPTGTVLSIKNIKDLINFTYKNNIWLLTDEVYESFIYSKEYISPLSFPYSDHVIGVYSFSKTYNMTGLRVGYIVSKNGDICNGLLKAQELYISCAPSISQKAAIDALKLCEHEVECLRNKFKTKLDIALDLLGDAVKYVPDGAFYILIDISKTGLSSDEFADILLETEKVAVAPGSTFGPSADKYIRISLTADIELLKEGIRRIKKYLNKKRENS